MNHRPNEHGRPNEVDSADARFDAAARAAHDAALQRVSARVEAQLHQRRRAALSGRATATPRGLWPMLAVGGTAALALAIGLRIANDTDPVDPSATRAPSVASTSIETSPTTHAVGSTQDAAIADTTAPNAVATTDTVATAIAAANDDTVMAELERLLEDADGAGDDTLLAANDDAMFAALDENPDLYLWLGSEESMAETTESL